jgi:hypothetical protein
MVLYLGSHLRHIVQDVTEEKRKEIISRWLAGDNREKICTELGLSPRQITTVMNDWKREIGSAIAESYRGISNSGLDSQPSDIIHAFKLALSLKKQGVTPDKLEEYIARFSKIALSSGIDPEGLASIVNQTLKLAELDGVELYQLPAHLESLQNTIKELEADIESLQQKKMDFIKGSPNQTIPAPALDRPAETNENLSQLVAASEEMRKVGLSISDISAFIDMVSNGKKHGFDLASIIDFVSSVGTLELERNRLKVELESLAGLETRILDTQRSLEQDISSKQAILDAATLLKKKGFDSNDIESLDRLIKKVADVNGISDMILAKKKLLEDIDSFYSSPKVSHISSQVGDKKNDQTLRSGKFSQEQLDILDRLAEKGIDEKTLMKWLIIKEIFRIDLDELADDLKKYSSVKVAASRLEERRARLESEELVMRHRLLALQERGQPVASATRVTKPIDDAAIPRIRVRRTGKELDMVPLIKAAEGEMASVDQDVLDKTIADLIDLIREVLEPRGFTKTLLDHAKLSLEHDKKTAQRHI